MRSGYCKINTPWYETKILNCTFCGKVLANQYWQDSRFSDQKFCEQSCANTKKNLISRKKKNVLKK